MCVLCGPAGILQVWNVSQQQPQHNLKVGNVPAQSLQFFPGTSRALITFQDGTVSWAVVVCTHISLQQQGCSCHHAWSMHGGDFTRAMGFIRQSAFFGACAGGCV
jgi:hypothetical protein